jgi:DNA topoisomerase-1
MALWSYIRHGAFCVLPKGENPLDIDFERAKELIDEKALLMHLLHSIKGRVRKVLPFWSFIKWNSLYKCK